MNKIWIICANAAIAHVFSASQQERHLVFMKTLKHSNSLLKEQEFATARPGHYQKGHHSLRGSYEEPNHKKLEKEQFAKEICQLLEEGQINHFYNSLIIIAEPNFYRLFNQHASPALRNLVKHHLLKNYADYSLKVLPAKLEAQLAEPMKLLLI